MRNLREALGWRFERHVVPFLPSRNGNTSYLTKNTCLISQPMRSGGTLLTRLLDGHPSLNVRPYHFMAARKSNRLDGHLWIGDEELNRTCKSVADLWKHYVYDPRWCRYQMNGYRKRLEARHLAAVNVEETALVLDIDSRAYYAAFHDALRELGSDRPPFSVEKVVAATFAGLFASWRSCAAPPGNKLFNVSHAVRHATSQQFAASCKKFHQSMPNGKLATIIRDPYGWAASYSRYMKKSVESIVPFYRRYLEELEKVTRTADSRRHMLIPFEHLINSPGETVDRFCRFLDVPYHSALDTPTHNGVEEKAPNTVFPGQMKAGVGVDQSVLKRKKNLSADEIQLIDAELVPVYERIASRTY